MFGDLYGHEVNLAARLVAAADPSTVLASERVRAGVGDRFAFDPIGDLSLKGFPEPVTAYRVQA